MKLTNLARTVMLAVALTATLTACDTTSDGGGGGGSAAAELACTHFRNIVGDISKGILTDAEARSKFQEVNDNASIADEPDIVAGGDELVASMTTGTSDDVLAAIGDMDSACSDAGF
jgi:hypothetical protein